MLVFSRRGYERIKEGLPIPDEWIEFAFERLAAAAEEAYNEEEPKARYRKVAQKLYLSGRKEKFPDHMDAVELLLIGEALARHLPDPLKTSIDFYIQGNHNHATASKNKKVLRSWYREYSDEMLKRLVKKPVNGEIQQWAKAQIARRNREKT